MSLKFTKDHEWVKLDGNVATVGISDYAQHQLGDVVFVELPAIGKKIEMGKEAAVVESVKAASEVYAPLTGEITAVNENLASNPSQINEDPTGNGWFFKITLSNTDELNQLMDEAAYGNYTKGL